MSDERKRILDMLSRGVITVEECDQMLGALTQQTKEKMQKDVEAARGTDPATPIIIVLLVMAVPVIILTLLTGFRLLFLLTAAAGMACQAFWIWMLIDCILRQPGQFRLFFSLKHETDKWVWLAIVALLNIVGAITYFVLIYLPSMPKSLETSTQTTEYVPSPPAKSVRGFIWTGISLATITALIPIIAVKMGRLDPLNAMVQALSFPIIVMSIWLIMFWIWMVIDCLARDYRDFGVIFPSARADKLLWLVLVIATFGMGGIYYHIAVRRRAGPERAARKTTFAVLSSAAILLVLGLCIRFGLSGLLRGLYGHPAIFFENLPIPRLLGIALNAGEILIAGGLAVGLLWLILQLLSLLVRSIWPANAGARG